MIQKLYKSINGKTKLKVGMNGGDEEQEQEQEEEEVKEEDTPKTSTTLLYIQTLVSFKI
jgi:hypothetical protein